MKFSTSTIGALTTFFVVTKSTTKALSAITDDIFNGSKKLQQRSDHHGLRRLRLQKDMNHKNENHDDITTHDNKYKYRNKEPHTGSSLTKYEGRQQIQKTRVTPSRNEHSEDEQKEIDPGRSLSAVTDQGRSLSAVTGTCYLFSDCYAGSYKSTTNDKTLYDCYDRMTSGITGTFESHGTIYTTYYAGSGFKSNTDESTCIQLGYCKSGSLCDGSNLPVEFVTSTVEKCFSIDGLNGNSMSSFPPINFSGNDNNCLTKEEAGFGGDPHFNIWGHNKFSYHGECDLVMIQHPSFYDDKGLELQIRTTRVHLYSFIESAALKIGSETIHVESTGDFKINGFVGTMFNTTTASFGGFEFSHWHSSKEFYHRFQIIFDNLGGKLDFKVFEGIIYVSVSGGIGHLFKGSHGMSGDSDTGRMLGRDGTTLIEDPNYFALEWQVRPDVDATLFDVARPPQWPEKCLPPQEFVPRLGGSSNTMISREEAEVLCANSVSSDKDNCIFDVIATGNRSFGKLKDIDKEADFEISLLTKKEKGDNMNLQ